MNIKLGLHSFERKDGSRAAKSGEGFRCGNVHVPVACCKALHASEENIESWNCCNGRQRRVGAWTPKKTAQVIVTQRAEPNSAANYSQHVTIVHLQPSPHCHHSCLQLGSRLHGLAGASRNALADTRPRRLDGPSDGTSYS